MKKLNQLSKEGKMYFAEVPFMKFRVIIQIGDKTKEVRGQIMVKYGKDTSSWVLKDTYYRKWFKQFFVTIGK